MAFTLFGFRFGKDEVEQREERDSPSFVPPSNQDGSIVVAEGNFHGTVFDMTGGTATEADLITKYREMAEYPDVEYAVDDIVNEAISIDEDGIVAKVSLESFDDGSVFSDEEIQEKVQAAFKRVLELMDFSASSYKIFRQWYIDGRIYYHVIVDQTKPGEGIRELRYVDPRKIRRVKEVKRDVDSKSGAPTFSVKNEYYVYSSMGFGNTPGLAGQNGAAQVDSTVYGLKIAKDSVAYCHSGLFDKTGNIVLSYLHSAMRTLNALRAMEDSMVIYRLTRAPERRAFYIDVGNLPRQKAEQYIREMMVRYKNKLVYDPATGLVRDDRRFMTMQEDFWLPRREGGKGTEIVSLPGAQNLGQIDDIELLQQKLYRALRVPVSRMDPSNSGFAFSKAAEISRDEAKFSRFVDRLRRQFSELIINLLTTELMLTGVITGDDVEEFRRGAFVEFTTDNSYTEIKDNEVLSRRIELAKDIQDFVGKYFSHEYVRKKVFRQDDDEIEAEDEQIDDEKKDDRWEEKPDGSNGIDVQDPTFGGGFPGGMPMPMPGQPGAGMPMMPGQPGAPGTAPPVQSPGQIDNTNQK